MRITEVALMWQATMDFRLIQRVSHLVWKNTRGEARDNLRRVCEVGGMQDIIVDMDVIAEKRQLGDRN